MPFRTAILFFSRSAQNEARAKPLCRDHDKSQKFYSLLQGITLEAAGKSGIPVVVADESVQGAGNFADRLDRAVLASFEKGYDNLIVIGNDTPDIDHKQLKSAYDRLQDDRHTVGPSRDGGVYLFTITRESYSKGILTGIDWNTSHVFIQMRAFYKDKCHTLQAKNDIDRFSDVFKIFNRLKGFRLFNQIWSLFNQMRILVPSVCRKIRSISVICHSLRGPPGIAIS